MAVSGHDRENNRRKRLAELREAETRVRGARAAYEAACGEPRRRSAALRGREPVFGDAAGQEEPAWKPLRLTGERSLKTGLEPGTPVAVGIRGSGPVAMTVCRYDGSRLETLTTTRWEDVTSDGEAEGMVRWIQVRGIHDMTLLKALGGHFGLHPLLIEDVANTEQRAKAESYGDTLFLVVKLTRIPDGALDPVMEQISLVLTGNTVISFQDDADDLFGGVLARLRVETSRLRNSGADHLLYALLDEVTDNCFDVLEAIGTQIETVEDTVMADSGRRSLRRINRLRRQLLYLHRAVWPMREVAGSLSRGEHPQMRPETLLFLRDVHDHTIVAMDTIETYRDLLNGLLDIYLSASGNRMNAIMKVLTIISTIFMPLTFIAGVYGMNFHYMPELTWRWGYFAVLGVMAVIAVVMLWVLRRKKWI